VLLLRRRTRLLTRFARHLEPGGFVALVDIDDLFGHEPLPTDVRSVCDALAELARTEGRYDFFAGRKLEGHLRAAGLACSDAKLALRSAGDSALMARGASSAARRLGLRSAGRERADRSRHEQSVTRRWRLRGRERSGATGARTGLSASTGSGMAPRCRARRGRRGIHSAAALASGRRRLGRRWVDRASARARAIRDSAGPPRNR